VNPLIFFESPKNKTGKGKAGKGLKELTGLTQSQRRGKRREGEGLTKKGRVDLSEVEGRGGRIPEGNGGKKEKGEGFDSPRKGKGDISGNLTKRGDNNKRREGGVNGKRKNNPNRKVSREGLEKT